jgi:ribonuclease D
MISLDTETTGLDLKHGAKPFLVTFCDEDGVNTWFEWDVDPKTREPVVVYGDLQEIQDLIDNADSIVLQNATFDVEALQTVFLDRLEWDWSKVYDTLLAGHLLASNQPHDLTSMVLIYLGINIKPYEDALAGACREARDTAGLEV